MEKIFVGWAFIAVALVGLIPLIYLLVLGLRSKSWSERMAMVTYNSLAVKKAGYWESRLQLGGDLIKYSYNVDRVDYEGTKITCADIVIKLMVATDDVLANYPEQEMLAVYYNPKNPSQAVLQPGITKWNLLPLVTLSIFLFVGLLLVNGAI